MFMIHLLYPYLGTSKSTSLSCVTSLWHVHYRTHGTHYFQNVIQIGTLKKFKGLDGFTD